MRVLRVILAFVGALLIVVALLPLPAVIEDVGGCAGRTYEDSYIPVDVQTSARFFDKTGVEVSRPKMHIEWGIYWRHDNFALLGSGHGNDWETSFGLTNIPANSYDNNWG